MSISGCLLYYLRSSDGNFFEYQLQTKFPCQVCRSCIFYFVTVKGNFPYVDQTRCPGADHFLREPLMTILRYCIDPGFTGFLILTRGGAGRDNIAIMFNGINLFCKAIKPEGFYVWVIL